MTTTVTPLRIRAAAPPGGQPLDIYTQFVDLGSVDALREVTQPLPAAPAISSVPTPVANFLRLAEAVADATSSILRTARDAAVWLTAELPAAARAAEVWDRRRRYPARHAVKRRWYGRTRSSAEVTGVLHRQYAEDRALTIPVADVPTLHAAESLYWVGWSERLAETLQAHDEALHPTTGHRFICS